MATDYERGRVGLLLVDLVNENFSEDGNAYSVYAPPSSNGWARSTA